MLLGHPTATSRRTLGISLKSNPTYAHSIETIGATKSASALKILNTCAKSTEIIHLRGISSAAILNLPQSIFDSLNELIRLARTRAMAVHPVVGMILKTFVLVGS